MIRALAPLPGLSTGWAEYTVGYAALGGRLLRDKPRWSSWGAEDIVRLPLARLTAYREPLPPRSPLTGREPVEADCVTEAMGDLGWVGCLACGASALIVGYGIWQAVGWVGCLLARVVGGAS